MNKTNYWSVFTIIIIFGVYLFYKHGRSIYKPILTKITGKETMASIKDKIDYDVFSRLSPNLTALGLNDFPDNLCFIAYKKDQLLHVYTQVNNQTKLIKSYPFTAYSGVLGPKLAEGDKQIPEGVYGVEYLNPNSSYYLSIKVNYPNTFDRKKAQSDGRQNLGSDIFIHGKDVTIGCIPVGDLAIEELFALTTNAGKQNVKIIIAPYDLRLTQSGPKISNIQWEDELYDQVKKALENILGPV